jgi:hypothetical protein
MSFSSDLSALIRKTKLRPDQVLRKVALDGYRGLLGRSPVDTGRFRGNWRIGVNVVDLTANEETAPAGEPAGMTAKLGEAKFGDTIYLTNNLPYAGVLENGMPGVTYADGRKAHSPQAPTGVLRNTFEDLKNRLESAVRTASEDER